MARPDDGHPEADAIVAAARDCIGTRFRLQGRSLAGLDCVGLALACARSAGLSVDAPADYRLRGHCATLVADSLARQGFRRVHDQAARPGDLLLTFPAENQAHLALLTDRGVVEADCALRRVVERPLGARRAQSSAWRFPAGGI
ncbi:MAG: NlpC/P60 family protein [Thermaurantiacus sp.]